MKKSYLKQMKKCCLFKDVSDENICEIADNYSVAITLKKGESVTNALFNTKSLFVIIKGSVSVTRNDNNQVVLMNILKSGDIFGMSCLFSEEEEFITDITSNEEVRLLVFPKESVIEIFKFYPQISINYISILSDKISFLNKKIGTYTKTETIGKVASLILSCMNEDKKSAELPFALTKVAQYLSASRISVYRAFDSLEERGIIIRQGRNIDILNLYELENI